MKREALPAVRKGRPPSEMAASHAVIMDAVYALLEEKSVRDLTIEAVAQRAGVGKPTLYKWWPTKATLVLAMLCERMAPKLEKPTVLTAEQSLRFRVRSLIDAFNGPFGKIVAGLIAEGQSEPAVLLEFFDRWVSPRRNATIADLQRGKDAGELGSDTDPELLNYAIFGAIYYRTLLRSGPLTGSPRESDSTPVIQAAFATRRTARNRRWSPPSAFCRRKESVSVRLLG